MPNDHSSPLTEYTLTLAKGSRRFQSRWGPLYRLPRSHLQATLQFLLATENDYFRMTRQLRQYFNELQSQGVVQHGQQSLPFNAKQPFTNALGDDIMRLASAEFQKAEDKLRYAIKTRPPNREQPSSLPWMGRLQTANVTQTGTSAGVQNNGLTAYLLKNSFGKVWPTDRLANLLEYLMGGV